MPQTPIAYLLTAARIAQYEGLKPLLIFLKRSIRSRPDAGFSESTLLFELLQNSPGHRRMIDVGAHHGNTLEPFLRTGWTITAFEPDPDNRAELRKRFGKYPNLRVSADAVSDTVSEDATFFRSTDVSTISTLSPFDDTHLPEEHVRITTLTEAFDNDASLNNGLDFLKIDTEGFDLMVLKGHRWDRVHPRAVLCEFEDKKTVPLGYTFRDIGDFLVNQGYSVFLSEWYPITRYGVRHTWKRLTEYPCELHDKSGWGNFLATTDPSITTVLSKLCRG